MPYFFDRIKPLEPIETGFAVNDRPLAGIKAVLFDIYGTLLISAAGDVLNSKLEGRNALAVLDEFNLSGRGNSSRDALGARVIQYFKDHTVAARQRAQEAGRPDPEVDVIEIWQMVLTDLEKEGGITDIPRDFPYHQFAMSFELYNNAVYPMPGMIATLESIRDRGLPLGIISNAQYFTPIILKYFFAVDTVCAPLPLFHERLQVYSFVIGRSKPDSYLYELMANNLSEIGLAPQQCLYIGNDMLNDISPAAEVGFKTVLFAGDRRSLRLRENHPRCIGVQPDRSVTSLPQILNILS